MAAVLTSLIGGGGLKSLGDLINDIKGKSPEDAAKLAQINADVTELKMKYAAEFDAHTARMEELEEQGTQASMHDQAEIDKVEAAAAGTGFWGNFVAFFKSCWRPACGWVCALAFFISFVVGPCWSFWQVVHGRKVDFPQLNSEMLTTLLFGLLGLAGARSFDKTKGTAGKDF